MKYVYAALFTPCAEGGYDVRFPDLEVNTQGNDLHDALYMAEALLNEWLEYLSDKKQPIPAASPMSAIKPDDGQFVTLIRAEVGEVMFSAEVAVSA